MFLSNSCPRNWGGGCPSVQEIGTLTKLVFFFSREWVDRRVVEKRSGFTTCCIMRTTRVSFLGFQHLIFLQVCTAPPAPELGETDPHCPQKQNKDTEPKNYSHHLLAVRLDCPENQTQLPKAQLLPHARVPAVSDLPILPHSLHQKDCKAFYCWSAIMELNI